MSDEKPQRAAGEFAKSRFASWYRKLGELIDPHYAIPNNPAAEAAEHTDERKPKENQTLYVSECKYCMALLESLINTATGIYESDERLRRDVGMELTYTCPKHGNITLKVFADGLPVQRGDLKINLQAFGRYSV